MSHQEPNLKRTGSVLLFALLPFIAAGCASSAKAVFAQRDPIALVSVTSNGDINWQGEESTNPNTASPLSNRALRTDEDLTLVTSADELINTAEIIIRDKFSFSQQINLAEKETVLLSRAYRNADQNRYQIYDKDVKPEAYEFIDYRDKNFPPALAAETGIQRCMFVEFDFTKVIARGMGKNGNFRANVEMKVFVLDAEGKTLYSKAVSVKSLDTIKVSYRAYSQTGIIELFESTIDDVCDEFLNKLGK